MKGGEEMTLKFVENETDAADDQVGGGLAGEDGDELDREGGGVGPEDETPVVEACEAELKCVFAADGVEIGLVSAVEGE